MSVKLALIQMSMDANPNLNLKKAVALCEEAGKNGANVICLPEMYRSLYFCQEEKSALFDLAEPVDGPSFAAFSAVAKAYKCVIVVPIFEKRAKGLFHNSVIVVGTHGENLGVYRKMHIPDDPGFYEKYYFTPGDLGFKCFDTPFGKIGVLICWDQWFPEAARLTALQGADILIYPTAIGWHPSEKERFGKQQLDAWQTIQRSHAIANGVFVASVNRVGFENPAQTEGLEFWGHSFVCDPQGVFLAQIKTEATIMYTDIDHNHIETIRRNWPFLRDRRIDAYPALSQRWLEEN
jgi:N-carbamoylputrescine amidase